MTNIYNTALCLACSSSLRPSEKNLFKTSCCNRPICPPCLTSNPRLARYNPCLACLSGVGVVGYASGSGVVNLDGGRKDEDTFVLGDEDEEEEELPVLDVSYRANNSSRTGPLDPKTATSLEVSQIPITSEKVGPAKYYLKSDDTLSSLSLRFGVNGLALCRLNNLPPSTLSTTPHILHTRGFILIPPSARGIALLPAPSTEDEVRLARERAEKRLQTVTKETDWRVAKAYVALTSLGSHSHPSDKGKEIKQACCANRPGADTALEASALDQYLDDEEWEKRGLQEGRGVNIPRFPYFSFRDKDDLRGWTFGR